MTDIFEITQNLISDTDDMVQKGSGWLLKLVAGAHTHEGYYFLMEYRNIMPRLSLRYSIEKMPAEWKSSLLSCN